jgi:hypothetical protein
MITATTVPGPNDLLEGTNKVCEDITTQLTCYGVIYQNNCCHEQFLFLIG